MTPRFSRSCGNTALTFGNIKSENGLQLLLAAAAARAKAHPVPFGHWYIDGGVQADHSPQLTCVSYQSLEPMRAALLKDMQAEIGKPGMGPEELRTHLARLGSIQPRHE